MTSETDRSHFADRERAGEMPLESLRVIEVDFRKDSRWETFISSHPEALIYHHPSWLAALESEYGSKCVALACESAEGEFKGILPLLRTRGLPFSISRHQVGPRLSSLPRTPLAGPLADSNEIAALLVRAAVDRVRSEPGLQLELKTTVPGLERMVDGLHCVNWRDTFVRGLPANENAECASEGGRRPRQCSDCDQCREFSFGNSRDNHQIKWAIKKAVRLGLAMRTAADEDDLREWYRQYLQVMRRNVIPPRPYRFFRQLWKEMRPSGKMILVLAQRLEPGSEDHATEPATVPTEMQVRSREAQVVSGSILMQFGSTVFWAFTGIGEGNLSFHANDLTLWHCMHESCKQGYRWFDLGEVAEEHPQLSQFKAKWGTIRKPMYRYYYPFVSRPRDEETPADTHHLNKVGCRVWRRLPLSVTRLLGDWIFSYL